MKLLINKTVAGNGYMGGAFNGSSHYFTKVTPTGTLSTVTNNFTIEANVQPTAYAYGGICGNIDSGPANGWFMDMLATGQVRIGVYNAGAANYSIRSSYQSLPLNKKTHVSASWTSGTVVMYFDGVAVPTSLVNSGTLPVVAAVGGTFSIGRVGAVVASLFSGYLSNVAVFDAVLSAATIKQHSTYKLTGSETNCIGAWSLDNTAVNQQAPGTNDLTATGGVGYTAITPHGQLGDAVQISKAVGLVMAVSGTDVTVQCPEGVTIPTTGGITSVSYSTQANPFGWVSDKGRWEVSTIMLATLTQATPTVSTYYFGSLFNLSIPAGKYAVSLYAEVNASRTVAGELGSNVALSTSSSAISHKKLSAFLYNNPGNQTAHAQYLMTDVISNTTATTYYAIMNAYNGTMSGIAFASIYSVSYISAIPSSL
jgi:hypothetical protein